MTASARADRLAVLLAQPGRFHPRDLAALDAGAVLRDAHAHHVVPLVSHALDAIDAGAPVSKALHAEAAAWALRERGERDAIRAWLDAAGAVPLLLFKGASTAHTLYGSPWLRMREDWDVLAAPGAEDAARASLAAAGFVRDDATKPGRVRMRQQSFRRGVPGSECIVDLHYRALNPPALADRIPYRDLDAHHVSLPALHPRARGLADDAALVVACAHRLAHHSAEPRLAWDYDVLLIARRIDAAGAARAATLAAAWGVGALVTAEVRRVSERFEEPLTEGVAGMIEQIGAGDRAAGAYLRPNRTRAREFALDWRVLGWRDRLALVRETVMPDPAFVRATAGSRLPLPLLYLARIARGMRGWFTR